MKKYLLASLVLLSSPILLADNTETGSDTRIDYIGKTGQILWSTFPENNTTLFNISEYTYNGVPSYSVNNAKNAAVYGINFVQGGTQSHPLSIKGTGGVSGSFSITDEYGRINTYNLGTDVPTRSRDNVVIDIRIPKGAFPQVRYRGELTYKQYDNSFGHEYWASSTSLPDIIWGDHRRLFYGNPTQSVSATNRERINNYLSQDFVSGWITPDESDPELWHISFQMGNEPSSYEISYITRDNITLRNMVNGALESLYSQWDSANCIDTGDGLFSYMFGEYISGDLASNMKNIWFGLNEDNLERSEGILPALAWTQAFAFITQANVILKTLEKYDNIHKSYLDWAKAQMLGLRSYGYLRLLQCFAPRWADSDNGNAYCAPLETEFSLENMPLATMNEIIRQCYTDLDLVANLVPDKYGYHPSEFTANVAYGLKLRIAQLCEDWNMVEQLSSQILRSYPLTTNEELKNGFFSDQPSWIWSVSNYGYNANGRGDNKVYYWSMQNNRACNGTYPAFWTMGCDAIDKDLYYSMSETDIRRSLFVMPGALSSVPKYNEMYTWYKDWSGDDSYFDSYSMFASHSYNWEFTSPLFTRHYNERMRATPYDVEYPAFTSVSGGSPVPVTFGSHVKFYQPGQALDEAKVVLMRADEIQLSRAESLLHLGRNNEAVETIAKLNRMRDPEYSFTSMNSNEIMDEIIRTRKLELWGEGHSWFDMKRWNRPIVRRKYESLNPESGNWQAWKIGVYDVPTDAYNGWRGVIYSWVLEQNPAIDINLMNYKSYITPEPIPTEVNAKKAPQQLSRLPLEFNPSTEIE